MNQNLTEIAYILDRSGSMQSLCEPAITGFNSFLREQQDTPGEATFSLVLFDDEYQLHADRSPICEVRPLDASSYVPRGCTALLDAIGRSVDHIGKQLAITAEKDRPAQVIVAIYTDGYENASTDYTEQQIRQMIRHQTNHYGWKFLFLGAHEDAITTACDYGIDPGNASIVNHDTAGTNAAASSYSRKIRASRKLAQGSLEKQDLYDSVTPLAKIVSEETQKFKN